MISSSQRPLPGNTQHSQQTNIHASSGIRTRDLSRRAAADLHLRPCGHWDRHIYIYIYILLAVTTSSSASFSASSSSSFLLLLLLLLLLFRLLKCYIPFCGFQYSFFLHSRRSLAIACRFIIPIIFKYSLTSSLHLLRGLPCSLFLPLQLLQFVLAFYCFAFFQHDHTILVGGIL